MDFQSAPINSLIVFLIDVTGISLMITVFLSDVKKLLKYIFISMTLLMFTWVNLAFFARITPSDSQALILIRVAWSITPLLFVLVYSFMTNLLQTARKRTTMSLFLYVLAVMFIFVTLFTDLIIQSIGYNKNGVLTIGYGSFVWFFFGWVAGLTLLNFYVLIRNYRIPKQTNTDKTRITVLILGLTIFFIANAIFNIFLPVFAKNFELYEFGDYSTIVFLGILAYSLVRHDFFGIRIAGTAFLVAFLGSFLAIDAIFFSTDSTARLIKLVIIVLYIPFGYLLVQSVLVEIKQREELEKLTAKLKELDARKDEFLNVAAHELRAPMTAIKGYLSMIKDGDAGQISPRAMEFLGDAMSGNDRLIRLVNNMLNISRIEEGRMVFDMGIVDLNTVVETVFNDYQIDAKAKGLDYRFESDALSQFPVEVDKDRIHEVVGNLISNSIKYTDKGIVLVKVFKPSFDRVRVEISDTGPGISPQEQQKLFQKFYRAESTIGKQLGTGLGLYVSKLLVEKFKGRIGFQSELGKGTTFWFELPINKSS